MIHDSEIVTKFKTYDVGTVEFGDAVYVTDPCYEPKDSVKLAIAPGTWHIVKIFYDDTYIVDLAAFAAVNDHYYWAGDFDASTLATCGFKVNSTGVDSGQITFADAEYYDEHFNNGDCDDEQGFYCKICAITESDAEGGILDDKVAAIICGDGNYPIYTFTNSDGLIVAISVDLEESP